MINNYKYFVGKVCTVLTHPVGMPMKDPFSASQYFTGQVTEVNEYGIWLKHLQTGGMSFFIFPIVGVIEEQYIPKSDPEHEKIKEEVEQIKNPPPKIPPQNMTSISELTRRAREMRKKKDGQ